MDWQTARHVRWPSDAAPYNCPNRARPCTLPLMHDATSLQHAAHENGDFAMHSRQLKAALSLIIFFGSMSVAFLVSIIHPGVALAIVLGLAGGLAVGLSALWVKGLK